MHVSRAVAARHSIKSPALAAAVSLESAEQRRCNVAQQHKHLLDPELALLAGLGGAGCLASAAQLVVNACPVACTQCMDATIPAAEAGLPKAAAKQRSSLTLDGTCSKAMIRDI